MSTPCRRAGHNTLLSRSKVDCDSRMCLRRLAELKTLNLFIKNQAVSCISPTNPFHSEEWRFGFKLPGRQPASYLYSTFETATTWTSGDLRRQNFGCLPSTESNASLYGNTSHSNINTSCLAVRSCFPKSLHACQG